MIDRSTPKFSEFNPTHIPFQSKVIKAIDFDLDFSLGTHELLLTGSVGSSKTVLAAHLAIKHALKYSNARIGIGRKSLGDIKATIFRAICEQLEGDPAYKKVVKILENTAQIHFENGSTIEAISWSDKKFIRFRSRVYSMFIFEEAVESDGDFSQAFVECRQRVGRVPHIKESLILYLTNPAGPAHPLYKYFFTETQPTRHVFKSLTEQNPFLPKTYIEQLKRDLPPKEALRQLYGIWTEIDRERIYYAYKEEINFIKKPYNIRFDLPISISFDFNISYMKPMSSVLSQYDPKTDTFHFFDEIVIHGSRTEDQMDELVARGYLDMPVFWEVHGDATGAARTTNSKFSNYDIIDKYFANYKSITQQKVSYRMLVPRSNPPIRERHNIVNAYCLNTLKQNRLFVYEKCKVLNEGMVLTSLKKGADYIEDDTKEFQHVTTSCGYRVVFTSNNKVIIKGGNIG